MPSHCLSLLSFQRHFHSVRMILEGRWPKVRPMEGVGLQFCFPVME